MLAQKSLQKLNAMGKNTLLEALGITLTELTPDYLEGEMPVDNRTHQVFGILHGGASVALAETLGSMGAMLCVKEGIQCVGLEINANHLRPVQSGKVIGRASPIHLGRTTQIWEIRIRTPEDKLVCISRLTVAVLAPKP